MCFRIPRILFRISFSCAGDYSQEPGVVGNVSFLGGCASLLWGPPTHQVWRRLSLLWLIYVLLGSLVRGAALQFRHKLPPQCGGTQWPPSPYGSGGGVRGWKLGAVGRRGVRWGGEWWGAGVCRHPLRVPCHARHVRLTVQWWPLRWNGPPQGSGCWTTSRTLWTPLRAAPCASASKSSPWPTGASPRR